MPAPFHTTFDYCDRMLAASVRLPCIDALRHRWRGVGRTKLNLNDADGDLTIIRDPHPFRLDRRRGSRIFRWRQLGGQGRNAYLDLMRQTYDLGNAGLPECER